MAPTFQRLVHFIEQDVGQSGDSAPSCGVPIVRFWTDALMFW
jgi:hypothetical protein